MNMKVLAATMGLGAAAGAVAIMMVPRQSAARKLAYKAAARVEDAATTMVDRISQKVEQMD